MPIIENNSSSELTRRVKARALGLYSANLAAARLTNYLVVAREQNTEGTMDVVTQRLQGSCVCVDAYVRRSTPGINYSGPQGDAQ